MKPDKVSGQERVREVDLFGARDLLRDRLQPEIAKPRHLSRFLLQQLLSHFWRREVELLERGFGLPDLVNIVEPFAEADETFV